MSSEAQNLMIEVIDAHAYNGADVGFDMVRAEYCICGWSAAGDGVHTAHVASEVDKALGGLTRETVPAREGWILPPGWIGDRTAARWVSGWSET
ncbi:gp77 [Mycobacterium phage Omega]|uniref:Uncharacterized protein n=1 Tax=Mycobacterium phage Omega TaxID=2907835 RepID=Q854I7_BPMOM|nr:gp77 [Mycobacterium phage Omega]AAN12721.1 hypothetical protein PBI_OMEGA_77 [Mycobacterium phage Omega]